MGQESGRDQHRHLAVMLHGFEGRAHGHFRLSVSDVSADQPVHGFGRLHVAADVLDGPELIGCFFVLKGRFEFVIQSRHCAIRIPFHQLAVCIEVDQFLGHLLNIFFHPRGSFGPTGAAQAIEPRNMVFGSAVPLDLVQPIERNVKRITAGELENQEVALEILDREALEPSIFGDAVLHMHDVVTHVEIFQGGEEGRRSAFRLRFMAGTFREELLFRQECEPKVSGEKPRG